MRMRRLKYLFANKCPVGGTSQRNSVLGLWLRDACYPDAVLTTKAVVHFCINLRVRQKRTELRYVAQP